MPAAVATFAIGVSFGVVAHPVIGTAPAIVMSLVVFGASAQLAAVGTLGAGGVSGAATAAGLLMNLRFLPMGISVGPSLAGPRWRRALKGQAVVDASWALARREDGRFDWPVLLGASIVQALGWWTGTVLGALGGGLLGSPTTLGLDAVFPAFFLALLADDLRRPRGAAVAAVGAVIALALTPLLPPGLPIAAASMAALAGLLADPTTPEPGTSAGGKP
jgi:predicted branched-subunit amino acid permease